MSAACDRPIDPASLLDYWLDDAERPQDDAIEEHFLGCDECARRLQGLASLGDGVRELARRGAVETVVTAAFLRKAARDGLRMREYNVPAGGRVDCTVTSVDDLLVSRLQADFRGVARVALVTRAEDGPERRIDDVPIGPDAVELIVAHSMPMVRALASARLRMRLLAQDEGGERVIGEYTFDHARTNG